MNDSDYTLLNSQVRALLADEADALASASNFVALLNDAIDDINWLGIYVMRGDELVLGPFQGKPACVRLVPGSGVCGTAAATRRTQRIADVHQFDGHIVCDTDSRSELVVPLLVSGELIGVLDIDSPTPDRFSETDQRGVEKLCTSFCDTQQSRDHFI
ncbi:MAG: GAF domain-containing protein [Woeseiaceae bacterium]|nr:GAF domain-containing protein [Woeseiaceae bacterium]|tara:strand:- start:485 stop:958 length:474 start_codon:yes stop_codon:yes gene_type:complete